ncbi:MAG: hypothetical protein ACRCR2_03730 [Fusobacteriaceae bacterium]
MAAPNFNQLPLTDVKMVQVITKDTVPVTYSFDTSDEVDTEEVVEEVKDRPLTIKSRLIANVPGEDIVMGYDLKFKDNVMCPELLHLMQGGTLTYSSDGVFESYEAPPIGTRLSKKPFDVVTYSAEVDSAGETGKYIKLTWRNCKGTSVPIKLKDGDYYSNEYKVMCRPPNGTSPYKMEIVTELPPATA